MAFSLFNQTTVNGDENGILGVFEFKPNGHIIHSSIKVVNIVERTRILAYFLSFTNCWKADLISAMNPFLTF